MTFRSLKVHAGEVSGVRRTAPLIVRARRMCRRPQSPIPRRLMSIWWSSCEFCTLFMLTSNLVHTFRLLTEIALL